MIDRAKEVEKRYKEAKDHVKDWREDAREWYDFCAGNQWSDNDRALMEKDLRPLVTFNRTDTFVDAVVGMEVQNRQEVRFLPRELGDVGVNDLLTGVVDWVRDQCDAEDEETDAFKDLVTCGMGWTSTRIDYEEDSEGRVIIERIDPLEMYWDPSARKRNLSDAKWIIRVKRMSQDEIESRWPSKAGELTYNNTYDNDSDDVQPHDATDAWKYEGHEVYGERRESVPVVEYQWYEREYYYKVLLPTGMKEYPAAQWEKLRDRIEAVNPMLLSNIKSVKVPKRVYKRAFVVGHTLMEESDSPSSMDFTYKCMTGKRERNKSLWYGLVKGLIDPQKWTNKFFSSILHQIATDGKGLLAERDAFEDPAKAEEDWARTDAIKWMRAGAIQKGKVTPAPRANYPTGMHQLMEFSVNSFKEVAGVSPEFMGLAGINQPNSLETNRKQAGIGILSWCFDSLRKYRKEQGRILIEFVRKYIPEGKIIRISGQFGQQYVPLLKDEMTQNYDVIVDDAPSSTNMKEKVWMALQTLLPHLQSMNIPLPPDVIDFMPFPQTLSEKIKQGMQPPPPDPQVEKMKQMMQELQIRLQEAEASKDEATAQLNYAKAQETIAKAMELGNPATQQEQLAKAQESMSRAKEAESRVRLNEAKTMESETNIGANQATDYFNRGGN